MFVANVHPRGLIKELSIIGITPIIRKSGSGFVVEFQTIEDENAARSIIAAHNTQEWLKFDRIQAILAELAQLDVEVPRIVEDIIASIGYIPVPPKKEIIERKQALRAEYQSLQ